MPVDRCESLLCINRVVQLKILTHYQQELNSWMCPFFSSFFVATHEHLASPLLYRRKARETINHERIEKASHSLTAVIILPNSVVKINISVAKNIVHPYLHKTQNCIFLTK